MALIEMNELIATKNSIVKSASIQSPATIVKRARGPSADCYWSFSGAVRVFERIRLDHIVSSIRANFRNLFDQTAYQHFTLSREITLVFASQAPCSIAALADYERTIYVNPHYARAYNGRGTIKQTQNNLGRALADYKQAIRFDPTLAGAIRNWDVIMQFLRQSRETTQ
jgi:tetratricopeptide (TPR) repeat protein